MKIFKYTLSWEKSLSENRLVSLRIKNDWAATTLLAIGGGTYFWIILFFFLQRCHPISKRYSNLSKKPNLATNHNLNKTNCIKSCKYSFFYLCWIVFDSFRFLTNLPKFEFFNLSFVSSLAFEICLFNVLDIILHRLFTPNLF